MAGFDAHQLATEMGVRRFGVDHLKHLAPVDNWQGSRGGCWYPVVKEPYPGAWQNDDERRADCVVQHPTVYACVTLIANDIGKMPHKLVEVDDYGIWNDVSSNSPFWPVLRRPNRYQNHIQFKQWWIMSKLLRGNAYGLKQRDQRGMVTGIYLLDAGRVLPLVTESGDIYYQLSHDNLTGVVEEGITVPASEIIHDRMNCLFHPLVGMSPLFAAATVANIGLKIESNVAYFFGNQSNPGGILVAPGAISPENAARLKETWDSNYGGANNAGKIAVLGDGLKFEPMRMSAVDSQMIEILNWTDEKICSVFHVPGYKVGVGTEPTYANIESKNQDYYSQCLQSLIEEYEACVDEGIGLDGYSKGIELDTDVLIRMDTAAQVEVLSKEVAGGIAKINEARRARNRGPVDGGDSIWMQQQDTSLAALAERDRNPPVQQTPPALPPPDGEPEEDEDEALERFVSSLTKALEVA